MSKSLLVFVTLSFLAVGFSSTSFAKQPDRDADLGSGNPVIKAPERVWGDYFIEYGSDRSPEGHFTPLGGTPFECGDPESGNCKDDFRAYSVCGQNLSMDRAIENTGGWFGGDWQQYFVYKLYNSDTGSEYEAFPITPSTQLNCKPGIHEFQRVWGGDKVNEYIDNLDNQITLTPKWKGKTIEVRMDVWKGVFGNDPVDLNWMKITNDQPSNKEGSGWIKAVEQDNLGNSVKFRKAKTGVTTSDILNLNSWMQSPLQSCTREAGKACSVSTLTFNSVSGDISTSGCNKDCPFGHYKDFGTSFSSNRDVIYEFTNSELIRGVPYSDGENPQKDTYFTSGAALENDAMILACGEYHQTYPKRPVYSPIDPDEPLSDDYSYDQFVCNSDTGEWESVSICSDGVDNDGDGAADLEGTNSITEFGAGGLDADSGCTSLSDSSETYGGSCEPRVGRVNDTVVSNQGLEDNKVAFYNPSGNSYEDELSSCTYSDFQSEIPSLPDETVEFTCDEDGNIVNHPVTSTGSISLTDIDAGEIKKKMQWWADQSCSDVASTYPSSHGSELSVSQVKYKEEYLSYGTNWASEAGYMPFIGQTLHSAENVIDSDSPHNYSAYLGKGILSSNAAPYQSPENPSQFSKGWTVANFLAENNPRVRGVNPVYDSSGVMESMRVFLGGYYGKCPESNPWGVWNGEEQCQPNDYKIFFDYLLPDIQQGNDNVVGFKLIPATFIKFSLATGEQLDGIEADCWRGQPEDRPADIESSGRANSNEITGISGPTLSDTIDKIEDSYNFRVEGVPTGEPGEYTCSWNITDKSGNKYTGEDFRPYNWFQRSNSAEEVIGEVDAKINNGYWPETIKSQILPDYWTLSNVTSLEQKVEPEFFDRDRIAP